MNKILFIVACLFMAVAVHAQDVIVLTDGSTIIAKVQKVTGSEVEYKKHSNPDGPTYTISIAEIVSINYENGEKDSFSSPTVPVSANSANRNFKTGETASQFSNDRDLMRMYELQNLQMYKKRVKKGKIITAASGVLLLGGIVCDIIATGQPDFFCYGPGEIGVALTAVGAIGVTAGAIYWYKNAKKVRELERINVSCIPLSEFDFGGSKLQLNATLMNSDNYRSYGVGFGVRYNF